MDASLVAKGLIIGLSVAAPIGPMSLLVMRRAIARGFSAGIVSGLGIALADATYAAIAAFGLTTLSDVLVDHQRVIRLAGGIALLVIGWRLLRAARTPLDAPSSLDTPRSHGRILAEMYGLTLSNPTTIVSFAAIFGGLGLALGQSAAEASFLVISVFAGSMLWWFVLCAGISRVRARLTPIWIRRIDLAASGIILVMAVIAIVYGVR